MRIDPPYASAVQLAGPHEYRDLFMIDSRNPVNAVIRVQELAAPTSITNQQLAVYEVVPGGFVPIE